MAAQSGIYEIVNTVNGKRYIGSAKNLPRRWAEHRRALRKGEHRNRHLQFSWNKHAEMAFMFKPILVCHPSMLTFYEQQLLDKVKPEYNIAKDATAPMTGRKHSAATRAKMSEKLIGNSRAVGFKYPMEACEERSKRMIGNKWGTGFRHTDEARRRISEARKGHAVSDDNRAKQAAMMRGNQIRAGAVLSAETRAKMSATKKARNAQKRAAWGVPE